MAWRDKSRSQPHIRLEDRWATVRIMTMRVSASSAIGLGVVLLALGCGSDSSGPPPPAERIVQIARPPQADTILAAPLQALVVEVRTETGATSPDVVVRFTGLPVAGVFQPTMFVQPLTATGYAGFASVTTDTRGRAAVQVVFGLIAGSGLIEVAVPEIGASDTVAFTVQPGQPYSVRIVPMDTAIRVGGSFQFVGHVLDRFNNPRTDAVSFAATAAPAGAGVVTSGGQFTSTAPSRVTVVASAGQRTNTAFVSVVPNGTFAANSADGVVLSDLDGGHRQVLVPGPVSGDVEPAWAPSGQEIAIAPSGTPRQINFVSVNGSTVAVSWPAAAAGDPYWPTFSSDGQFLYFSDVQSGSPVGITRVKRDGSGVETVAPGLDYRPTVSPDGKRLAYHTVVAGSIVVQVYDLVTRAVTAEFAGAFPEWAPIGAAADLAMVDESTLRIVLISSSGANRRYLTPVFRRYAFQQMSWSPRGDWLLVRGELGLELIEISSGLVLPLPFSTAYSYAVWNPGT